MFKSIDGGLTWKRAEFPGQDRPCVTALSRDPASPDHLYTTPGRRSLDGGETWQSLTGLLPGGEVVVDLFNPRRRYGTVAKTGGFFMVSSDEGASWQQFTPGGVLPEPKPLVKVLDIDPISGRLFMGTELGLYRSGDGGKQCAPLFENSPGWYPRPVTLAVDPGGAFLFAAMPDRDIWRLSLTTRGRPARRQ